MNKLYFEIMHYVLFVKSKAIIPWWTLKKLNIWKFTGVSLLLWTVQIAEKHQYNHTPEIGNKIVVFWIIFVIVIACGFINNSAKDQ